MSMSLTWFKPPSEKEELGSNYDIKWPLAKRYGEHDGSCHEQFDLTEDDLPFLEGLLASDKYPAAEKMIADIRRYGAISVEIS